MICIEVNNMDHKLEILSPYRRMAVALAYGHEDVKQLVEKAKEVARKISVK
jgi:hypothetical protein